MRIVVSLMLLLMSQTTFSQTWEKIKIDDRVSITVPGESKFTADEKMIKITSNSSIGELTIERTNLLSSVKSDSPGWIRAFTGGFMYSMERLAEVETVDARDEMIKNVETRNILVKARTGQFTQLYFFSVDHKMYILQFKDNTTSSPEQRQKIFSSIEISN